MLGTFFTLDRARRALDEIGAPAVALDLWFAQTLRDAFALSHSGGYRPLEEMLRSELPRTLRSLRVKAGKPQQDAVMKAFAELDPAPGAGQACAALTSAGWRLLALTNGSVASTTALLTRAGLLGSFDSLLSCDQVRKTKPHPEVYAMAKKRARGDLWLVAAHSWDVAGASRAGLRTAWIATVEPEYLGTLPVPEVSAADLADAARAMLRAA